MKEEILMKMKKVMAAAVSSMLVFGMLTGCGGSQDKTETAVQTETETAVESEVASDTEAVQETAAEAAVFKYTGDDPYMETICDWMLEAFGGYYDAGAIVIPSPEVLYTDDTDPEKVRVWGDFWMFSYSQDGDVLMNESGGSNPGLLYLEKDGEGYKVTDFDAIGDGAQYSEDVARICSEAPEEAGDLVAAYTGEYDESVRKEFIKMYVEANGLSVTAYQDFGWDPVPLD